MRKILRELSSTPLVSKILGQHCLGSSPSYHWIFNRSAQTQRTMQGMPADMSRPSPIGFPPGSRPLYRYQQLRQKLVDYDQKRQQRQQHFEQLRYLQRLLEPYQDSQKDIQPNLITRDGELVQELEKMRMLVARVGGRIAQQKKRNALREEQEYLLPGSKRKLDALLDEQI